MKIYKRKSIRGLRYIIVFNYLLTILLAFFFSLQIPDKNHQLEALYITLSPGLLVVSIIAFFLLRLVKKLKKKRLVLSGEELTFSEEGESRSLRLSDIDSITESRKAKGALKYFIISTAERNLLVADYENQQELYDLILTSQQGRIKVEEL